MKNKYIIVGAGLSSLQAATILAEHDQEFVILEATERIGGRVRTLTIGDALIQDKIDTPKWIDEKIKKLPIECGATWISEEQPVMLKMAEEFKITLFDQNYSGANVMALSPKEYLHLPDLGAYYNLHKDKIKKLLNSMKSINNRLNYLLDERDKKTIKTEQNNELNNLINRYDSMSAAEFIKNEVQDDLLANLLINEAATLACAKCQDYSALNLIAFEEDSLANVQFYIGEIKANIDGFRIKEGTLQIVFRMKQKIQNIFDKQGKGKKIDNLIKLNSPVIEIRNHLKPVEVVTKNGEIYVCETVITGLPIATLGKIKFGSISAGKLLTIHNQLQGVMARQAMIFKKPFWRPKNSGYVSFSHQYPMNQLVDLTPSQGECGILGFVFTADGFQKWKDEIANECKGLTGQALRKKAYQVNMTKSMKIIADLFCNGDTSHQMLQEVALFYRSFIDFPYIKSAYQAITATNTLRDINAVGEDIRTVRNCDEKNVIILGSDFSDQFGGYMEGAIRVANRKIKKLMEPKPSL